MSGVTGSSPQEHTEEYRKGWNNALDETRAIITDLIPAADIPRKTYLDILRQIKNLRKNTNHAQENQS